MSEKASAVFRAVVGIRDLSDEEAIGAEMISYRLRELRHSGKRKLPLISAGCPSILNLIQIRFPNLMEHVVDYRPPVEVVASMARREAERRHPDKKVGIFFYRAMYCENILYQGATRWLIQISIR